MREWSPPVVSPCGRRFPRWKGSGWPDALDTAYTSGNGVSSREWRVLVDDNGDGRGEEV